MYLEKWGRRAGLLVLIIIVWLVFSSLGDFNQRADEETLAMLEEVLRTKAVQCYALEGNYPPDLEYLVEHYGLILNREAFFYHYEIIGSNIVPEIRVYHRWQ